VRLVMAPMLQILSTSVRTTVQHTRETAVPCRHLLERRRPLLSPVIVPLYRALGAGLAIAAMEALAAVAQEPVARVPFVTSIVLVLALPDSPAAQPRALIGGHILSCLVGWICLTALGQGETASAIAVGLATVAMIGTGMLHPPAGLDAFLIAAHGLPTRWIFSPVLIGTVMLAVYARLWAQGERHLLRPLMDRHASAQHLARQDKEPPYLLR
jgi:CBS-domain-containing membrane protein